MLPTERDLNDSGWDAPKVLRYEPPATPRENAAPDAPWTRHDLEDFAVGNEYDLLIEKTDQRDAALLIDGDPRQAPEYRELVSEGAARLRDLDKDDFIEAMNGNLPEKVSTREHARRQGVLQRVADFDAAERDRTRRPALRAAILAARTTTPEQYARAKQLSKITGIPAPVVDRNMEDAQRQADFNEYDQVLIDHPELGRALSDPEFAKVARDDTGPLSKIENAAKALASSVPAANAGLWGVAQAGAALVPGELGATMADTFKAYRDQQAAIAKGLMPDATGLAEGAVYSGLQSLGITALTLPASIMSGSPAPTLATMSAVTGGKSYGEAKDKGLSTAQSVVHGMSQAAIEYATEKLPMSWLLKDVRESAPLVATLARNVAAEIPGEQAATVLQDLNDWATLNPEKTLRNYLDERPTAAAQTLIATLVGSGGQVAIAKGIEGASRAVTGKKAEGQRAKQAAEAITTLAQHTATSKLLQRDPAALQEYVATITKNGDVFVDAESFAQSLEAVGADAQAIIANMPTVAEQLDIALTTNGTIRIPVSELTVGGAPLVEALAPHLRATPVNMSATEADSFFQDEANVIREQAQHALDREGEHDAFATSAHAVEAHLLGELTKANRFTADVNNTYATLARDFYVTQAARVGSTPEQLYDRYPLKVVAEDITGTRFDQIAPPGTPQFSSWFGDSKVTDGTGAAIPVFHGSQRPDRVGNRFRKSRATSGPMAFFTDSPDIASNYAAGKGDTSLATEDQNYENWFKYKPKGARSTVSIDRAWWHLSGEQRSKVAALAPRITTDENGSEIILADEGHNSGLGGYDQHIREARGNHLKALVEEWLNSGSLINDETSFMKVLKLAGVEGVQFDSPNAAYSAVLPVYLSVRNPLDTATIPTTVVEALEARSRRQRGPAAQSGADMWDKRSRDPQDWIDILKRDHAEGQNSTAWTSIPDWVTETLKSFGYDGIKDTGGKLGGEGHTVWIPFEETQIKSAIGNQGTFDRTNANILKQGKRGAFSPSTNTIALLKNADLSTFVHELGHFNLEVMVDLAQQHNAPEDIAADAAKLMTWFKVDSLDTWQAMTLEEKRPHHEAFARAFEAYLFEGKAPSTELQSTFARIRAWMMRVYKSLIELNVELSDEVRGVFDRMLASEQAIRETVLARDMVPMFDRADFPGDDAAWREYEEQARAAHTTAVDTLQARSLRDMRFASRVRLKALRSVQADADNKRAAVREEVAAEVAAQPVYAVQAFLRRGTLHDSALANLSKDQRRALTATGLEGTKLDLPTLKELYGEEPAAPWRYLSTGPHGLAGNDGIHPDMAAELFGFTSGDALVRAILEAPPFAETVEAMTDQRTLERYGDLSNPAEVAKAADEAVHDEVRQRFVATELKALQNATYNTRDMLKAITAQARAVVAGQRVDAIRPAMHTAAESRAARTALKALGKGDTQGAIAAKQEQLWHSLSAKAAQDAEAEVMKAVAYLRKVTRAELDEEYSTQIASLLDRHDLRTSVTDKALNKRQSLLEWLEGQRAIGFNPVIDDKLIDEAQRQHYRRMTLEEFRGLVDTVKNIEHLGRLKHKLLTSRDERVFTDRVTDAVISIKANATKTVPERLEKNTFLDRVRDGKTQLFALHRKTASIFREMDGSHDNGTLWNLFTRPMNDAGNAEAVGTEQATIALTALFKPLFERSGLNKKRQIPGTDISLSREGAIMIALNTGNEGNLQRLVDGEKWDIAEVQAILTTLDKIEWDFVQGIWDYLDTYRPQIGALEKDLNGVEPKWVDAVPIQTPFGTYRGGYLPVKYDADRSSRAESDEAAIDIRQAMRGAYGRATTRDSFTKARAAEVKDRPVRKDFGVIFQHIGEVNHRLAWQRWLIDVNRLLGAKPIDAAIREHYGSATLKALKSSVTDIAAGNGATLDVFERQIARVRQGVTVAYLGWNVMTSIMQPLGLTQSMVRIGPKWVAKGLADFIGSPQKMAATVDGIHAKSDFMRLRGKTMQREISEIQNRIRDRSSVLQASYFYFIQKMQMVADVPTWLGAYHKAVDSGANEDTSIALADQAVLDAQGGGQLKDLAGIQRGGEVRKLFTNFYSYFNTTYNLTAERTAATDFKSPAEVGLLAVDYLLLFTVPAVLGYALRQALVGNDDDEDKLMQALAREQLSYLFGSMVGLREIGGMFGDHRYQGPAGLRFLVELAKLFEQAQQGDVDGAFLKAANATAGMWFHYPAGQIARSLEGVNALNEGDTSCPTAVLFGPPRN